jgi:hypothetical protein
MAPWFQSKLFFDDAGEMFGPFLAREGSASFFDEEWLDEVGSYSDVIEDGSQLQNLPDQSDVSPFDKNILMSDDGLKHAVRLIFHPSVLQDEVSGDDTAFEFERHFGRCDEAVCCSDVVEETCYVVGFSVIRPRWEMGFYQGGAIDVNTIAMVKRRRVEFCLNQGGRLNSIET